MHGSRRLSAVGAKSLVVNVGDDKEVRTTLDANKYLSNGMIMFRNVHCLIGRIQTSPFV